LSSEDRHAVEPILTAYKGIMALSNEADGHLIADAPKLLRQRDALLELLKKLTTQLPYLLYGSEQMVIKDCEENP
jgi:hypothetical protein